MNFAVENTNVMNILFKNTKENKCYEEFVEDPSDRKKLRAFNKIYGPSIAGESVKLHKYMKPLQRHLSNLSFLKIPNFQ